MPEDQPRDPEAHVGDKRLAEELFNRALNAHDANNLEEAYDLYAQVIAADPTMEIAYNNIGMVLIDLGNYQEAIGYLKKAVELKPDYAEPYNNLGFVCRRIGDDKEAARNYRRFLELQPDTQDAERIRMWADEMLADEAAEQTTGSASAAPVTSSPPTPPEPAQQPPTTPASGVGTAGTESWLLTDEEEEGGEPVSPAETPSTIEGPPSDLLGCAEAAYNQEDFETALSLYEQVLEDEPSNAAALSGKGGSLLKLNRIPEAVEVLSEAIRQSPQEPSILYLIGFAYRKKGDEEAAADAFERFLSMVPDAEEAPRIREWIEQVRSSAQLPAEERHYNRALTLFQEGSFDEALTECEEAVLAKESHGPSNVLLGRILLRKGDYIRAVASLKKAAEVRAEDPEVFFYLGQAFEKRGLNDEAREAYENCLAVSPSGPRADRVRQWLEQARRSGETALGLRCEYCLRTFPENQLFDYQEKKACRDCLSHLGIDADTLREPPAGEDETELPDVAWETFEEVAEKKPKRSLLGRLVKAIFILLLLVAVGVGVSIWLIRRGTIPKTFLEERGVYPVVRSVPWLKDLLTIAGLDLTPPDSGGNGGIEPPPPPPAEKYVESIEFRSHAPDSVGLLQVFRYEPEIEIKGEGGVVFSLEKGPAAARIDETSGSIVWNPIEDAAVEELPFQANFLIKAAAKKAPPNGRAASTEQTLAVSVRFPYTRRFERQINIYPDIPISGSAAGDFNNDGSADLAFTYGTFNEGRIEVYYRNTPATFSGPKRLNISGGCRDPITGDLDGDGDDDLAVLVPAERAVEVFLQDENRTLDRQTSIAAGLYPLSMARPARSPVLFVLATDQGGRLLALKPSGGEVLSMDLPHPVSVFSRLIAADSLYVCNLTGAPLSRHNGKVWQSIDVPLEPPLNGSVIGGAIIFQEGIVLQDSLGGEPTVEKAPKGLLSRARASEADAAAQLLLVLEGNALEVRVARGNRSVLIGKEVAPGTVESVINMSEKEMAIVFSNGKVWGLAW